MTYQKSLYKQFSICSYNSQFEESRLRPGLFYNVIVLRTNLNTYLCRPRIIGSRLGLLNVFLELIVNCSRAESIGLVYSKWPWYRFLCRLAGEVLQVFGQSLQGSLSHRCHSSFALQVVKDDENDELLTASLSFSPSHKDMAM